MKQEILGFLSRLRHLREEQGGQTLIAAALCMVVLVGFLGLAIDVGQMRLHRRQMQAAADAAATAAALEISSCGSSTSCAALTAAAQDALVENGYTGSTLLTNCASGTGTRLELTVNQGPCAVAADPNTGKSGYVEVMLSQPQPTLFARVLGLNSLPLRVRSEAAQTGGGNCIYALDPSGSNALTVDFLATLTATCGIVDESSSSSALSCNLFAAISATHISVVGGASRLLCSISPTATTGIAVPTPADPLASMATPTVPACGTTTKTPYTGASSALTLTGTAVLYPGKAYCGGITIKYGANVTFQPGTYVISSKSGTGGLTVDVGATVSGTGVTFYNVGPSGGIAFNYTSVGGAVKLIAPTTGTYAGVLFFQDPQDTAQATILGNSSWSTQLQGTYYFPKAKVLFAFSGAVDYNILVAYDIEFELLTFGSVSTSSGFSSDYSSLANGSPVGGSGAAVVE